MGILFGKREGGTIRRPPSFFLGISQYNAVS